MKKIIISILSLLSILIIIYSVMNIINWCIDTKKNKKIKEELNYDIKIPDDILKTKIDFQKFKEKNPDTVAYIEIKNTNINYIVVKGNDNDYYLNHNFFREENKAGWVFSDYRNKFDGTDKNIIIYGHNMKDGRNLGTLKNVLSRSWYNHNSNLYIPLITEKENMIFKVFSIYQIKVEDYYIETNFKGNEYFSFINILKSRSIYDFNTKVNKDMPILTLSTCTDSDNERTVLHAIRIK